MMKPEGTNKTLGMATVSVRQLAFITQEHHSKAATGTGEHRTLCLFSIRTKVWLQDATVWT